MIWNNFEEYAETPYSLHMRHEVPHIFPGEIGVKYLNENYQVRYYGGAILNMHISSKNSLCKQVFSKHMWKSTSQVFCLVQIPYYLLCSAISKCFNQELIGKDNGQSSLVISTFCKCLKQRVITLYQT